MATKFIIFSYLVFSGFGCIQNDELTLQRDSMWPRKSHMLQMKILNANLSKGSKSMKEKDTMSSEQMTEIQTHKQMNSGEEEIRSNRVKRYLGAKDVFYPTVMTNKHLDRDEVLKSQLDFIRRANENGARGFYSPGPASPTSFYSAYGSSNPYSGGLQGSLLGLPGGSGSADATNKYVSANTVSSLINKNLHLNIASQLLALLRADEGNKVSSVGNLTQGSTPNQICFDASLKQDDTSTTGHNNTMSNDFNGSVTQTNQSQIATQKFCLMINQQIPPIGPPSTVSLPSMTSMASTLNSSTPNQSASRLSFAKSSAPTPATSNPSTPKPSLPTNSTVTSTTPKPSPPTNTASSPAAITPPLSTPTAATATTPNPSSIVVSTPVPQPSALTNTTSRPAAIMPPSSTPTAATATTPNPSANVDSTLVPQPSTPMNTTSRPAAIMPPPSTPTATTTTTPKPSAIGVSTPVPQPSAPMNTTSRPATLMVPPSTPTATTTTTPKPSENMSSTTILTSPPADTCFYVWVDQSASEHTYAQSNSMRVLRKICIPGVQPNTSPPITAATAENTSSAKDPRCFRRTCARCPHKMEYNCLNKPYQYPEYILSRGV